MKRTIWVLSAFVALTTAACKKQPAAASAQKEDDFTMFPVFSDYKPIGFDRNSETELHFSTLQKQQEAWVVSKVGKAVDVPAKFYDVKAEDGKIRLTFFHDPSGVLIAIDLTETTALTTEWANAKRDEIFQLSGRIAGIRLEDTLGNFSDSKYWTGDDLASVNARYYQQQQSWFPLLSASVDLTPTKIAKIK